MKKDDDILINYQGMPEYFGGLDLFLEEKVAQCW